MLVLPFATPSAYLSSGLETSALDFDSLISCIFSEPYSPATDVNSLTADVNPPAPPPNADDNPTSNAVSCERISSCLLVPNLVPTI